MHCTVFLSNSKLLSALLGIRNKMLPGKFSVYFSGTQIRERKTRWRDWQIIWYSVSLRNSIAFSKHFSPSSRHLHSPPNSPPSISVVSSHQPGYALLFFPRWMKRWKASEWKSDDLSTLYCYSLPFFLRLSAVLGLLLKHFYLFAFFLLKWDNIREGIKMIANCVVSLASSVRSL